MTKGNRSLLLTPNTSYKAKGIASFIIFMDLLRLFGAFFLEFFMAARELHIQRSSRTVEGVTYETTDR